MDSTFVEVLELEKNYQSLTAKQDIPKGTFLGDFWGEVSSRVTAHSIQVGTDKHIEGKGITRFTNHSCSPNAQFVYSQRKDCIVELGEGEELSWHLVAQGDIQKGEAITYDYTTTEYTMVAPFHCLCGSKSCLGKVQGFNSLSLEEKKKRLHNASPVICALYKAE